MKQGLDRFLEAFFTLRTKWCGVLLLALAFFSQVPFYELINLSSDFPYFTRNEEWPRFLLHTFQFFCVLIVLSVLYLRGKWGYWKMNLGWGKELSLFFLLVFTFWIYWIPLGFDVTDEGRRMSHSWFMLSGMWEEHVGFKMGGHLLKGAWLHILPGPSVLWARLSYALLKAFMALFVFNLFRNAYPREGAAPFFCAFLGMLSISIYSVQVINYNNLPVTLMLASISFFYVGKKSKWSGSLFFLSGLLIPLAVLARFPFIVFLFLPVLYFFLQPFLDKDDRRIDRRGFIMMGAGLLSGGFILLLFLWSIGGLDDYVQQIQRKVLDAYVKGKEVGLSSHEHDPESLMSIYLGDLQRSLVPFSLLTILFMGVGVLTAYLKERVSWSLFPVLLFALISMQLIFGLDRWSFGMVTMPWALFVLYLLFGRGKSGSFFILFWGIALFILCFPGTNNGFINICISGGGILFFTHVLFLFHSMRKDGRSSSFFDAGKVFALSCLFIVFFVIVTKPRKIYRDLSSWELTEMMDHPSLFGIFSHPERVDQVNGILEATDEHIRPGKDDLLTVNTCPVFYYLTGAPYKFRKSWDMRGKTKEEMEGTIQGSELPGFLLVMHKDPRTWWWPKTEKIATEKDLLSYEFYLELAKGQRYRELYTSECFSLYERKRHGQDPGVK